MSTHRNVKELRQFLGFAGYYMRFVKGFADIARHLNNLLMGHPCKSGTSKKKRKTPPRPFTWATDQQKAYDELKTRLVNPPTCKLACADNSKLFLLHP